NYIHTITTISYQKLKRKSRGIFQKEVFFSLGLCGKIKEQNARKGREIMGKGPTIRLGTIIDQFHLEVLYGPEGYRDRQISIQDVNRPGLQMTGYFDYFDRERMQLLGLVEWSYLQERTAEE